MAGATCILLDHARAQSPLYLRSFTGPPTYEFADSSKNVLDLRMLSLAHGKVWHIMGAPHYAVLDKGYLFPSRSCVHVRHVHCVSDYLNLEPRKHVPHRSAHQIWRPLS